jgi:hypothetical protein
MGAAHHELAKPDQDSRKALRHHLYHVVKVRPGAHATPRECLLVDISDEGVRIYVVGFEVAEEFILLFSHDDDILEERYKVIWRRDGEIGAKFIGREPLQLSIAS